MPREGFRFLTIQINKLKAVNYYEIKVKEGQWLQLIKKNHNYVLETDDN